METVYTPLEGSYCSLKGQIDTRDKESVTTVTSREDLNESDNEELENEEGASEVGGASDGSTGIMNEKDSNQSSYVSSSSSSHDSGHLGLMQLSNGYVKSNGSIVESSGQSHGYVQINNGHMVETMDRPTEVSSEYIQTTNGSNGYMEEESSGISYGYVQINTGQIRMNDVFLGTNGSILSNGYIETSGCKRDMQSKSFNIGDVKFENDYIPNNFM